MAKYSKKAGDKVEKAMHEKKQGTLKSGRSGKKVTTGCEKEGRTEETIGCEEISGQKEVFRRTDKIYRPGEMIPAVRLTMV
jgi:hypothetical protein